MILHLLKLFFVSRTAEIILLPNRTTRFNNLRRRRRNYIELVILYQGDTYIRNAFQTHQIYATTHIWFRTDEHELAFGTDFTLASIDIVFVDAITQGNERSLLFFEKKKYIF